VSLRWKVAMALAGVALVATTAVGLIGYRSTSQRLLDEVDRSITAAAQSPPGRPRGPITEDRTYEFRLIDGSGAVASSSFTSAVPLDDAARALIGVPGVVRQETVEVGDQRFRLHTIGLPSGALQIARSLDETDRVLDDVRRRTVLLVVLVSIGAAAIGWLIATGVVRPLRRLTSAAEEVGSSGQLDVDVPGVGNDEVGRLGSAFRRMLDALSRSRAEQQRLVQDAGHELRTPLTSLRTNLAVLRRHPDLPGATKEQILSDLESEVTELSVLVNEIVAAPSGELAGQPAERVSLGDTARRVGERVGRRRDREVTVEVRRDETVVIPRAGLERAIANLVDNACKFDGSSAPVEVVVDGGTLRVEDRGPGIDDADLGSVFERFHRGPAARTMPGSGLGLSIVRDVVEAHGGTVQAGNRDGGGAAIGFTLPPAPD
jgi:two-component system, OmpR family, sensor histidine kinase MprB